MSGQLNIRTPKSTEEQISDLIDWTGMTQTQLVIQAIDRLHSFYEKRNERKQQMTARIRQLINDYNDLTPSDQTEAEGNLADEVEKELAEHGYYTYKDASGKFAYAAKDGVTQKGRVDPDPDHHYPN